ncbi:hypothetical protein LY78DRAFT_594003 [Colletotrichum sublineola]|nr:hypothetical protein LY78DRAFT_594003 [Colletotrichum sublineola]
MASSPTTLANATATSLLSITSPWVQPSDCETHWSTTTWQSTGAIITSSQAFTVSTPVASCNPPGWDRFGPESRLSFSPGVCPKGWVYNGMAEDGSPAASTAFCCQRDCVRFGWVTGYDSTASVTASHQTAMVHEAWVVTWAASDTATLTPKLPTLTSSMLVPTWTPGERIPDGQWDNPQRLSSERWLEGSLLYFLIIGMPIIGALMIASCIWCCVRSCKKKRRAKKAAMAAQSTLPADK